MMRDAITKALAAGEATAKIVAKRSGIELADVLKTLNHLQRDAAVEREKRHGNEYVYWLAATSSSGEKPEVAATDPGVSEGGEAELRRQIAELEADNVNLRNQAAEVEGVAADQRVTIARLEAERDELCRLADATAARRDQAVRSEAEKHERMLQACAESERLRNELAGALIDRDALREQLDAIPTVEAHTAGYLIRAPKRKPAIVTKPESAVARAMAAARNGSGRAEVYALVLTGTARRGAEWRPAPGMREEGLPD